MKLIFLDCDGVIGASSGRLGDLDKEKVGRLNSIVCRTKAKVVLSSSWRKYYSIQELRTLFKNAGFQGTIVGKTPEYRQQLRGYEIQAWLDKTKWSIEGFVILDDDDDMGALIHRLVQIDYRKGLREIDVQGALLLLGATT